MRMYMPTQDGQRLMTNPAEIPGGFNLEHKGPSRVGEEILKQQIAINTIDTIMSFPTTRPDEAQKNFMAKLEFTDDEIEKIVMPMEELQQQQQQAQQAEQQAIEAEAQAEQQKLAQEQDFEERLSVLEHRQDIELAVVKEAVKPDSPKDKKTKSKPKKKAA